MKTMWRLRLLVGEWRSRSEMLEATCPLGGCRSGESKADILPDLWLKLVEPFRQNFGRRN